MDYTSLGELVRNVAHQRVDLGLTVAPEPRPEENLFLRSDHFHFARAGIPAIFFTTGIHEQYHKPSDVVGLIDTDKLARVARLVFYLGGEIATRAEARLRDTRVSFSFRRFDVEQPLDTQGMPPAAFDVVIAANVLHDTLDLRRTLHHLRALLAPGGVLLLVETTLTTSAPRPR